MQSTQKTPEYVFTDDFLHDTNSWGLTKEDALDVYCYGIKTANDKIVREYNGYEIGIKYKNDPTTGAPIIDSIWKK